MIEKERKVLHLGSPSFFAVFGDASDDGAPNLIVNAPTETTARTVSVQFFRELNLGHFFAASLEVATMNRQHAIEAKKGGFAYFIGFRPSGEPFFVTLANRGKAVAAPALGATVIEALLDKTATHPSFVGSAQLGLSPQPSS